VAEGCAEHVVVLVRDGGWGKGVRGGVVKEERIDDCLLMKWMLNVARMEDDTDFKEM